MPFLKNLGKSVGKAAEQAKFEADKMVRVNRLGGELNTLTGGLDKLIASIGSKVVELKAAGQIQLPLEIEELIGQLDGLKGEIEAKRIQLETAKAEKFEDPEAATEAQAPVAAASTVPPAAVPSGAAKFCPNCGAALESGARFCGGCGQKVG